jgi:hypothetical protein
VLLVLLPKTPKAAAIKDYRPISLIHVLGKLFLKVLANRLAHRLEDLVHASQSTFVKSRFIQDNFKFVQAIAKLLHARRKSSLLLKVDIVCAFDSMSWSFLLEVLQHMGFTSRWTDWVSLVLSTACTRVMLNGSLGSNISHGHGLRQGNPLSPMLFLLVMEVLSAMFHKADEWSVL